VLLSIVRSHDDPAALVDITRKLQGDGHVSLASRAATILIGALPDDASDPPDDLLRVAYPLAFIDLVEDAADEEGVSPLLLLALMRQESFYDPDAGSSAGALGLTQVIPTTGQSIADVLGVTPFEPSDLFRPRLSLRFGANYFASQLASFEGNAYHALAAYNGGPGTASNAIDSAGEDIDLFVEDLEFDETKAYVKLVMEHYARYRQLYEDGVDRPTIP
jgi:soluble lytic murein transglycosylase